MSFFNQVVVVVFWWKPFDLFDFFTVPDHLVFVCPFLEIDEELDKKMERQTEIWTDKKDRQAVSWSDHVMWE